jgi:signal transduction histidine kinase
LNPDTASTRNAAGRPAPTGAIARLAGARWLGALLALTLAVGAALLLAQVLMEPPASDMRALAAYLTLSGVATVAVGWLALRALDSIVGLSLQTKSFVAAMAGNAIAMLNIIIVAQLMFVSTAHDLRLLFALVAFSAVVTACFTLWFATATARRVDGVASVVRDLAGGDYASRAPADGADQVARLARDVNALAARLDAVDAERAALDAERRELTAAISHDLRTPLASVRAMIEALDDEVVADRAGVRRYYATMRRQIDRLDAMVDDLLELARIDAGEVRLERAPVALAEIIAEIVDAMQAQAAGAGVMLEARIVTPAPLADVDGARIERAIANLVRNAIEHTPPGGRVEVTLSRDGGDAVVGVRDSGDGIDAGDLPHLWTRFYRGDRSRAADGGRGSGLGLAITRGIIESHGGSVAVESAPPAGALFTARVPIAAATRE